jgi:hypothetical protein
MFLIHLIICSPVGADSSGFTFLGLRFVSLKIVSERKVLQKIRNYSDNLMRDA